MTPSELPGRHALATRPGLETTWSADVRSAPPAEHGGQCVAREDGGHADADRSAPEPGPPSDAADTSRLRGMPDPGVRVGAPAPVPDLRARGLLRLFAAATGTATSSSSWPGRRPRSRGTGRRRSASSPSRARPVPRRAQPADRRGRLVFRGGPRRGRGARGAGRRSWWPAIPRFGDLILRAYLLRRSILIGLGVGLRIVGSKYSQDTRRVRDFAARNRLPYRFLDLQADPSAEALLAQFGVTPQDTPVVIVHGRLLRNPGNAELAAAVGLPAPSDSSAPGNRALAAGDEPARHLRGRRRPRRRRPNASPPPSVRARWRSGSRSNEQVPLRGHPRWQQPWLPEEG